MADSAFLSRLPVRGAVFESSGEADAFKVPLLDAEGKINLSLVSNSATIYDAVNTAARLALSSATPGDFCIQGDNNSIYFLKTSPASQENSWIRLSTVQDSEQDFDSPNFTGVPTAPTAPETTNSAQLATTAFVKNLAATEIPEQDSVSGEVGTSVKFAREDHSHPSDQSRAPINSPTFTGTPTAPAPDYTDNNTRLATTSFVKQQSIDGFTLPRTNVSLNNFRITSLGTPINERDAATKAYVDALQSGLTVREPVKAATTPQTGNLSLVGPAANIDGVVVSTGDRVLVKNQTNPAQNGIYTANTAPGGIWQRTNDADSSLEMKNGVYVFVLDGSINKNSAWVLITSGNVNLNTTPLNFVYYTNQDANLILAGYGLIKETNTILVDDSVIASVAQVDTKQDQLISGDNIKTINEESLLGSGNITLTKESIGLANVDNTSDANKPVSTAQQTALNAKENTITAGTTAQYWRGDKSWQTLDKSAVGLSNVDNTSDANKPVSTAQQTALNAKVDKVTGKQLSTEDFTSALKTKLESVTDLYQSSIGNTVVSTQVGGASPEPASVWKTRTIAQALDTILFPTILPTITTAKSVSLTVSSPTDSLQEIGSTSTRTLTATFNQGRITNGDGSQGPLLVGGASNTTYSGPGITGSTGNNSLGSVAVISGTNQWTVSVSHNAGTGTYTDNKGNLSTALDGSRGAGTVTGSTTAFTGIYPWYYIKSPVSFTSAQFAAAITALGNNASGTASNIHASATITKTLTVASGALAVPYNLNNQFLGVAYEADNTTKTQYYVTDLDKGAITLVFSGFETVNNVAQAASSPRWTRNFKVHITNGPKTNTNATIELRNI